MPLFCVLPVEDVPALVPWLRALLARRIYPWVAAAFPLLADGTDLGVDGLRLRVHDAFIVRYDSSEAVGSVSLPEHSDTSAVSVTIALNAAGEDFQGGGLWLRAAGRALSPRRGCGVAFAGPLRHGGAPVTAGVRVILVLFLYVEGFAYGHLLQHGPRTSSTGRRPLEAPLRVDETPLATEAAPGGFVVYRETAQLMEALES